MAQTEAAEPAPAPAGAVPAPAADDLPHPAAGIQIGYPALPVDELVASLRGGIVNLRTTVPVKRGPDAIYPGVTGSGASDLGSLGSGVLVAVDRPARDRDTSGAATTAGRQARVLTNDHIVAQAKDIRVRLVDGTELPARVLGRAPELDVALLAVDAAQPLPTVPLGESSSLRVGEWVVALGNPFGNEVIAHVGVVASVDGAGAAGALAGPGSGFREYLVVDAAVHAANSGGPLVDMTGRVVGINLAAAPAGGAVGFAVPIDRVAAALEMLERDGRIQHAWLGVYIQPLTPELAAQRGLAGQRGALVSEVRPGTPGARAGLVPDDVILRFGGQPVDHRDLPWLVATAEAGKRIPVVIQREGGELELEVVPELRPQ